MSPGCSRDDSAQSNRARVVHVKRPSWALDRGCGESSFVSTVLPSKVEEVALNIKDPETDRLARELALATGESITVAARRAIEERLARVHASRPASQRDEIDAIIQRGRSRPVLDLRSEDEILGYGSDGLPT